MTVSHGDRAESCYSETVKKKSRRGPKQKPMNLPNPLTVDQDEFDAVVTKMLNTDPVTLKEVVKKRRNPERDPRYLPVFPAMVKSNQTKRPRT